jgi:hypothetical protein
VKPTNDSHKITISVVDINRLFMVSALILMWGIYVLSRAVGLEAISDEGFYIFEEIPHQNKRLLFLTLVQSFDSFENAWFAITIINILAVVISYFVLAKIYFGNYYVAFSQLLYFPAIASYVFRDSLLLLIVLLLITFAFARKRHSIFLVAPLFFLLFDFRPHFTIIFLLAFLVAYIVERIRSDSLVLLLFFVGSSVLLIGASFIGEHVPIYGTSLNEYLQSRSDRHGQAYSVTTGFVSLVKHYFAPVPYSLLWRLFYGEGLDSVNLTQYGALDDLYRFFYKSILYLFSFYLVLNVRWILKLFAQKRFEFAFLLSFSLANAIIYSAFAFGGGHERVKIFSTLFIFYVFAGVWSLKHNPNPQSLAEKKLSVRGGG